MACRKPKAQKKPAKGSKTIDSATEELLKQAHNDYNWRGSGLDPKRARTFNFTTVNDHFKKLMEHMREYGIPWENMYNMDEKGIQMGGGRKGKGEKFIYVIIDKSQYHLKSNNLQLVTIIKVVCANGTATIKPGFVFPGKTVCTKWMCEPGAIDWLAEVHTIFAMCKAASLCHQANQRAEKKDGQGRRIHVKARVMTSEEGLWMCEEDQVACKEKEQQKQEKQSQKDAMNKENVVWQEMYSATMVFCGALSSKNKTQLGNLAAALGFKTRLDNKQTKAQFLELINKKFQAEPELKDDDCFVGMFKRGHKKLAPVDDNTPAGTEPEAPLVIC
ncbi:hypothetical protein C0991_011921 [Blastosporella zonata]|nr:hypothetical protein C0991_011921 [Blastosporella zonata]